MPHTEDSDIPRLTRRLLHEAMAAEEEQRKQEKLRLRFLVGGDQQWEDSEITERDAAQRPHLTINECEPPVNKVVNEVANNPPGPECKPVGSGADDDTADIIAGMLRQIEYDSQSTMGACVPVTRYVTAAGRGVVEWGTAYASERGAAQKVVIKPAEDPALYYCDPSARGPCRQDATWRIKLKSLSRTDYELLYGPDRAVLNVSRWRTMAGSAAQFLGFEESGLATINQWTGGGSGPYWVAELWKVEVREKRQDLYDNHNWYFEDETPPTDAKKMTRGASGDVLGRSTPIRKVRKYVTDACELLGKPVDWITDDIPIIDALGPEIWIDGKLFRISLIHNTIGPSRGLNNVMSSATEIAGLVPLSPMMGAEGQFKDPKWATMNTEPHAYLEYTPVLMASDAAPERAEWAPPPSRNMWNASIDWLLNLASAFKQAIQETSETYDESLGKNRGDQSGKAVEALQAQSQIGNFHYIGAVHQAWEILYKQIIKALPKIYDGPRAQMIIRADDQHEIALINQDFPHPSGGKNQDGSPKTHRTDITLGEYSVRVKAQPSYENRQDAALDNMGNLIKAYPAMLQQPGALAMYIRWMGQGNPKIEQLADLFEPNKPGEEMTPEQMQGQLAQANAKVQQLTQVAQQLHQAVQAKQPQVDADKFKALLDSLTKIRVAEVNASKDRDNQKADAQADAIQQLLQMAHETATQATDQQHQAGMAQQAAAQPQPTGATQ